MKEKHAYGWVTGVIFACPCSCMYHLHLCICRCRHGLFFFFVFCFVFFWRKKTFYFGGTLSKRATKIESRLLVVHSTVIFSKRRKINAFWSEPKWLYKVGQHLFLYSIGRMLIKGPPKKRVVSLLRLSLASLASLASLSLRVGVGYALSAFFLTNN